MVVPSTLAVRCACGRERADRGDGEGRQRGAATETRGYQRASDLAPPGRVAPGGATPVAGYDADETVDERVARTNGGRADEEDAGG
jgi:hypothetical protein